MFRALCTSGPDVYAKAALGGAIRGLGRARQTGAAQAGVKAFLADGKRGWNRRDPYVAYAIERAGTVLAVPRSSGTSKARAG